MLLSLVVLHFKEELPQDVGTILYIPTLSKYHIQIAIKIKYRLSCLFSSNILFRTKMSLVSKDAKSSWEFESFNNNFHF
jgi:hypothetical protein